MAVYVFITIMIGLPFKSLGAEINTFHEGCITLNKSDSKNFYKISSFSNKCSSF